MTLELCHLCFVLRTISLLHFRVVLRSVIARGSIVCRSYLLCLDRLFHLLLRLTDTDLPDDLA